MEVKAIKGNLLYIRNFQNMQEQIRIRWANIFVDFIYILSCISICATVYTNQSFLYIIAIVLSGVLCDVLINIYYVSSLRNIIRDKRLREIKPNEKL